MQRTGADERIDQASKTKKEKFLWVLSKIWPFFLLIVLVALDQITKSVCKNLYENHGWTKTTVIKDFFYFYYTTNTGAGFSFLSNVPWGQTFFKILTSVALVAFFFIYFYTQKLNSKWLKVTLMFIIGGTIGNFIDRLMYNYVVDFISFIFGTYAFPTFNLADSFITVGVIMLIVYLLFIGKNAVFKKKDKAEEK